jgi:hypothetical protein
VPYPDCGNTIIYSLASDSSDINEFATMYTLNQSVMIYTDDADYAGEYILNISASIKNGL